MNLSAWWSSSPRQSCCSRGLDPSRSFTGVCCRLSSTFGSTNPTCYESTVTIRLRNMLMLRQCPERDSNPQGLLHQILSLARLPIPPSGPFLRADVHPRFASRHSITANKFCDLPQAFRADKRALFPRRTSATREPRIASEDPSCDTFGAGELRR